ncbi:ATP-binding protein [Anaerovorax odorimutans]|uniref:ATP-binding protein n=1 Tax=Anaerovorax odorimutans TaxID=109327 RepID=A0ABT1RT37_9FIRM|nr:ATP-binding protein [Anaerovorax odorimutans]MCQ4638377.1 ATP-binding protein [Anaerovorax odorimutans]
MKKKLAELNIKLNSLVIFRNLLEDPVIANFQIMADAIEEKDLTHQISAYCQFTSSLYQSTSNFSVYINTLLLNDENFYVKDKARGSLIAQPVEDCLFSELDILQELSGITSESIRGLINYKGFLPDWENTVFDFRYDYQERIYKLPYTGYGVYSKYAVFHLQNGGIVPVKHPDGQKLEELFGYEREQGLIIKNTEALISGEGASNMLLYGDAGTGKSSTIKAVCNHYASKGLRLLEVKKNEIYRIPYIVEELSANPLKFVIFIDDLSFTSNDDNFSALKAILEGSVSACGKNIAIYATSNRRHLVKETMGDRAGDELHINDTLQETMSLAARFGLTITYQRPDKEEYLSIVKNLARDYGVDLPEEELFKKAEIHALRCNGRSPRVAKQFIELQKIGI